MFNILIPDLLFMMISIISLLLWFRFKDGDRVAAFFRKVFFVSFVLMVTSLLWKYRSLSNDMGWLFTAAEVFVVGLAGLLIHLSSRFKSVLLPLSFVIVTLSFAAKLSIDRMALDYVDTPAIAKDAELLVKIAQGIDPKQIESLKAYKLELVPAFVEHRTEEHALDDYYLINIPINYELQTKKIKAILERSAAFEVVEWNEQMQLDPRVTDALQRKKTPTWANDPEIKNQWYYELLQMDALHRLLIKNRIKPKRKTRLFILDSGIDARHEDIAQNYQSIDKVYDTDTNGHGTHCAGIAGAVSNNHKGIASLLPTADYVNISSIKVMNAYGIGTQQMIIRGIIKAIDAGADVISLSLGGVSSDKKQQAYKEAFEYGKSKNVIFVVAGGNASDDASRYTPANVPGAITVSAVDPAEHISDFSNYLNKLKRPIAAPGVQIYSTMPNNKYAALNGTSMATPFVASLAALIRSIRPDITPEAVYQLMSQTGKKTKDYDKTGPLIQPYDALRFMLND